MNILVVIMKKNIVSFILFVFLNNISLTAYSNYFLFPIGSLEGTSGNTGIARYGSDGSVLYNPAGLAGISQKQLDVSGSAFSVRDTTIEAKGSPKYDKADFSVIPSQITSVYNKNDFVFGFSILTPSIDEFKYASDSDSGLIQRDNEIIELLVGPTVAYNLSDRFKIGLSLFGIKEDENIVNLLYDKDKSLTHYEEESTSIGIFPILGILFISDGKKYSLGFRFSGPSAQITGTARGIYIDEALKRSEKTTKFYFQRPMDAGVGLSYNISSQFELFFDFSHQFATHYLMISQDAKGEDLVEDYKGINRYNFGLEFKKSEETVLAAGLFLNPDPESNEYYGTFKGVTLGFRSFKKQSDNSYGLFYMEADLNHEFRNINTQVFGVFFAASLHFADN